MVIKNQYKYIFNEKIDKKNKLNLHEKILIKIQIR